MKKILFIFNPIAGKLKIKRKLFDIIDLITKNGYQVITYPTQCSGDAINIITKNDENYDFILCSGGDGTLSEVVTGIMNSSNSIPIGYIPTGSTNDFALSLKLSRNILRATQIILNGYLMPIDIGKFNSKYFVYVAAFGAFTDVPYRTPQKYKNIVGYLAYLLESIKRISDLKTKHIQLKYDEKVIEDDFIIGLITNSLFIGGFKNIYNENVGLSDGMFEVLLIKMPNNIFEFQAILSSLINVEINENYMYYFQTSNLIINSDKMEWTLDGEYGGTYDHVKINNINNAVQIFYDN
ncbi:diacylglycerol/lipid kinase family protein [Anaerocolumna sedimenticola]|uniref:diacylglycerol/lipid kinase family protein n=1 Tax=Anaerocolumna sedimenticola TaxID=2696063 RepID=UPI001FECDDB3|nr:YegS/Rv2252/BmrU family lipid kinase [Anaerocolumna sedimenticola]